MRINVDNTVAICVSCGMCVESWVTRTAKTFGLTPREYKCISLVMHNQDWERWAAWMCLCFNEQQLYASMSNRAIQIRSIMSDPDNECQSIVSSSRLLHTKQSLDLVHQLGGGQAPLTPIL